MKLKFALLVLGVFSLVGGLIFSYRSGLIDKLINGSQLSYSTASEHPDYYLKINDEENLKKAFGLLGYSYGRHIKSKVLNKSDLGGIRFILTNSPQSAYTVSAPEGQVLKSAGFDFDPSRRELLVYIHFSDEILKEIFNNDQGLIDATILDYLCIGDDGFKGADSMDNCTVIRKSVLGLYGSKTRLFSLERKKKLNFKIVKDVYAGCTGAYTCCVATSVCVCSSGGSCSNAGYPCNNYTGTCSCTTTNVVAETNDCVGGGGSCGQQSPSCSTGAWFPCTSSPGYSTCSGAPGPTVPPGDPCWPYPCPPTATPIPPPPTPIPTPTPTPTPTPIPNITVSGTVYDDPFGIAGALNKCIGPYGAPLKPGGGSKVRVDPDEREGSVQGNGSYTVNQVLETGPKNILLQNMDPQYQCTCPTGCQYGSANLIANGVTGWDFFVSQIRPRWLKVFGGSAHAQGSLVSNVPSGNVFIADFNGDGPGALTKSSTSAISFGDGSLSSRPSWNFNDQLAPTAWKYGYRAMWLRAGNPSTDPGDGGSAPAAGVVYRKTGDWTIGGGGWTNLSGSRVIFVDGNVTINGNVTLANGAFLGIVATGNITVNPTVGNATPKASPTAADANLTGAFFADGDFKGGTTGAQNDKQLVIYGSVAANADLIGGGSVSSQRDLGNLNAIPGVAFIWNPFLILNAPPEFTDAVMDWREVAP